MIAFQLSWDNLCNDPNLFLLSTNHIPPLTSANQDVYILVFSTPQHSSLCDKKLIKCHRYSFVCPKISQCLPRYVKIVFISK